MQRSINICINIYHINQYTINIGFIFLMRQEWNSNDIMQSISYMILMISFSFNIFIFCYIGELVAEQVHAIVF